MRTGLERLRIVIAALLLISYLIFFVWFLWFGTSDKVQDVLITNLGFHLGILSWAMFVLGFYPLSMGYYYIVTRLFFPESDEERLKSIKLQEIRKEWRRGKISKNEYRHRKELIEIKDLENKLNKIKREDK